MRWVLAICFFNMFQLISIVFFVCNLSWKFLHLQIVSYHTPLQLFHIVPNIFYTSLPVKCFKHHYISFPWFFNHFILLQCSFWLSSFYVHLLYGSLCGVLVCVCVCVCVYDGIKIFVICSHFSDAMVEGQGFMLSKS